MKQNSSMPYRVLTVADTREAARGQWLTKILPYVCPGVFDDAIAHLGQHVTCPFHGGDKDFRFVKESKKSGRGNSAEDGVAMCTCGTFSDGFELIRKAAGCTFREALVAVDECLNGAGFEQIKPRQVIVRPDTSIEDAARDAQLLAKVKNLWASARPIRMAAVPYYCERGIDARTLQDVCDTRYLTSLGYWEMINNQAVKVGTFPAILALMRNADGDPVAVHRTWLANDCKSKAPVSMAKKLSMTPGASGAAIRLYSALGADTLGLTEGIETAHAARQLASGGYWPELGSIPVWACYSAGNIKAFVIPTELLSTLKKLIIFSDNDASGTGAKAAVALKDRLTEEYPELEIDIKEPSIVGFDWNDVLVNL